VKSAGAIAKSIRSQVSRLWHRGVASLRRRRSPRIRYERVEDLPDHLEAKTLYVAGEEPYTWAAALLCPCGCGEVIQLNLLKQARPCWRVRLDRRGLVTLRPSVWRTKGCRSHFVIRKSRVEWCFARRSPAGG
jgi:hypothetical protein